MRKSLMLAASGIMLFTATVAPNTLAVTEAKPVPQVKIKQMGDQSHLDFTLVNDTGYAISALYISPSATESWEEDVLGGGTLEDQASIKVNFNVSEADVGQELWDIKVTWADGSGDSIWTELKLTTIETITLLYDKENDVASARTE